MVLPVPIMSAPISISHLRLDLTAGCRDLREEMLLRGGRWPLLSLSPSQPHRDMRAMSDHLLKVLSSLPPILGCVLALANWPALEFPFFLAVHCPEHPRLRPCFLLWSILVPEASSCFLTRGGTQVTCPTGLALVSPNCPLQSCLQSFLLIMAPQSVLLLL